jgi:hypothetical protein
MIQDTTTSFKSKTVIDAVQPAEDTLSSRGGLSPAAFGSFSTFMPSDRFRTSKILAFLSGMAASYAIAVHRGQRFAGGSLQIPPRDGHSCRPANTSSFRAYRATSKLVRPAGRTNTKRGICSPFLCWSAPIVATGRRFNLSYSILFVYTKPAQPGTLLVYSVGQRPLPSVTVIKMRTLGSAPTMVPEFREVPEPLNVNPRPLFRSVNAGVTVWPGIAK